MKKKFDKLMVNIEMLIGQFLRIAEEMHGVDESVYKQLSIVRNILKNVIKTLRGDK